MEKDIQSNVEIEYCTGCRWMLRAAWMAQELLTTFVDELSSVTLKPNRSTPGTFDVRLTLSREHEEGIAGSSDQSEEKQSFVLWCRKERGRFPESKELKQLVRDKLNPDRDLGHSDVKKSS